jgi:hypothetical protein
MELSQCKFYYEGEVLNFAVFSDSPCRARYVERVRLLPISRREVYVYEIEPGAESQWVVVRQTEGTKKRLKLFLRRGESFLEPEPQELPAELREQIRQRYPTLTAEFRPLLAARAAKLPSLGVNVS